MDFYRSTLPDEIYQKLKVDILSGNFVMGQQLAEHQLSQQYGVSRIPIRSALTRLASDGLIVDIPYRGHFVRPLDLSDIKEIYEARYGLESFAAELIYHHITQETTDLMQRYNHEYGTETSSSPMDVALLDLRFHEVPVLATKNSRLKRMWQGVQDEVTRLLCLVSHPLTNNVTDVQEEHAAILDAYRQRNLPAIRQALQHHFARAQERAAAYFTRFPTEKVKD